MQEMQEGGGTVPLFWGPVSGRVPFPICNKNK